MTGAVYRQSGGPIAGATVYVYDSDASGAYVRDGAPASEPRLCGILRTDSLGRYRIRTVMPGHSEGTPHIHVEVWGRGIERQAMVLNLVEAAPRDSASGPPLGWPPRGVGYPPMTRDSSGVHHCEWDIVVR